MRDLTGKVAVVTGGGSGIGEGLCRAFHEQGMQVVVSDIDLANAERVAAAVNGLAVRTDVRDAADVQALADLVFERYGEVHVLCNNAGVAPVEPLTQLEASDWEWGLAVNLDGIVHGLLAFLPRMHAQPSEGHVVNTASIAGVTTMARHAVYCATKHATVALSERVREEGREHGVSASVLCPAVVKSGILDSARNRPADLTRTKRHGLLHRLVHAVASRVIMARAIEAIDVGRFVVEGIREDRPYLFTHRQESLRSLMDRRLRPVEKVLAA